MKKTAVVILNYKVKDEAINCVKSVLESSFANLDIIVVDNNSADGLEDEINQKFKDQVFFIQSHQNLGYSGGNNLGIKEGLKKGADFIFVLNPDTSVEKNCIKNCVDFFEKSKASIIGPKVLFADKKTIWYAGGIFDRANVLGKHRGVDETDKDQYNKPIETDFVSGGAIFIEKEVFKKIGFFDEKYFLYYEDSDFCERARRAGFRIMYNPKALVYHANAKSTGLGSSLQDYFITRNRMLFASKFLSLRTQLALVRESIKNMNNKARRMAFIDFLIGNFGVGSFKI